MLEALLRAEAPTWCDIEVQAGMLKVEELEWLVRTISPARNDIRKPLLAIISRKRSGGEMGDVMAPAPQPKSVRPKQHRPPEPDPSAQAQDLGGARRIDQGKALVWPLEEQVPQGDGHRHLGSNQQGIHVR